MTLPTLAQIEPTEVTAGDTWQWQRAFSDYPISDGWGLSYGINGVKAVVWIAGWVTNDGTKFTVTIPKAITADPTKVAAGSYELTAILTGSASGTGLSNGQRVTFKLPTLMVLPDPAAATDGSRVSHAATMLPLIEAAIAGRVPADMQAYKIHGREITKIPIEELITLRGEYRRQLWLENHPGRSAPTRKVLLASV